MRKILKTSALMLALVISGSTVFAQSNVSKASIDPAGKAVEQTKSTLVNLKSNKAPDSRTELCPSVNPFSQNSNKALFDLQFSYAVTTQGNGVETDGSFFYTTQWNGDTVFKYDMTGNYIGFMAFANAPNLRDLAYDGQYFYGGSSANNIYQMDFTTGTLVSTITAPAAVECRHIAYDPINDAFWCGNWDSDMYLVSKTGTILDTILSTTHGQASLYGSAFDTISAGGPYLWVYSQDGNGNDIIQLDASTGAPTGITFDVGTVVTGATQSAGGLFIFPDIVSGYFTIGGIVQNEYIWGLELASTTTFANDLGIQTIVSPVSGPTLTNAEALTVKIVNYGSSPQSNFPVSIQIDNGTPVTETVTSSIAGGASLNYTFTATGDFSTPRTYYNVKSWTGLSGDMNTGNDTVNASIVNTYDIYCDAGAATCDEFIDSVIVGTINNLGTGCGLNSYGVAGYSDYTAISTDLDIGTSYPIVVGNGLAYSGDECAVWVDWNQDGDFEDASEEYILTSAAGGYTFTGNILPPNFATNGNTRMRVRITYSTTPTPCGEDSYGEVEDYTINVTGSGVADDAGTQSVDVPAVNGTGSITPMATVYNFGTAVATFDVTMTIGTGYTSTKSVTALASGTSQQVSFDAWTAAVGNYNITVYTSLSGDMNTSNDTLTKNVDVMTLHSFYGYVAYDATGTYDEGPFMSYIEDPGTTNFLAATTSDEFICGGAWANNIWYAVEYEDAGSGGNLYTIDTVTGAMTIVGNMGMSLNGISYDVKTNTMFGVTSTGLYSIDLSTAAPTLIGDNGGSGVMIGLACSPNGQLYTVDITDDNLYTVDKTTGALTLVGSIGFDAAYAQDMEFDLTNDILYMAAYNGTSSSGELQVLDVNTGAGTLVGAFEDGMEVCGFAIPYDPSMSVENFDAEHTLNIFPNPANDMVQVLSSSDLISIQMHNLIGQLVKQLPASGTSADVQVNDLTPGLYLITIESEAGKSTHKLIVK